MMKYQKLVVALSILMLFALPACSSKTTSPISTGDATFAKKDLVVDETTLELTQDSIVGLWSQGDNLYYFAEDGQFISFTNTNIAGGSWALNNKELAINLYDKTLVQLPDDSYTGVIKNNEQMLLVCSHGDKSVWERSSEKVASIPVAFFIRERMMLPPVILIETKLSQENKSRFVSRAVYKTAGANTIPMNVYYLEDRVDANKTFELDAVVYHENSFLFVTPKTANISLKQKASLQIMLVQPDDKTIARLLQENAEDQATLHNTYWKLIKLEGKTPKIENTELHLILRHGENAMQGEGNGNDGCNNFFLSWAIPAGTSKNALDLNLGGSTMMMCTDPIMAQAQQYMMNLDKVNKYTIQGNTLLLQENNKTRAVFEAVAL